ncbi:hypothetical protein P4S72_14110 [Vibrio sp. PP-XX7]
MPDWNNGGGEKTGKTDEDRLCFCFQHADAFFHDVYLFHDNNSGPLLKRIKSIKSWGYQCFGMADMALVELIGMTESDEDHLHR